MSLERVFPLKEDRCSLLYAVAGFLQQLNAHAAQRSGAMIEYTVGGVAAVVEPLRVLGNQYASKKMHYTDKSLELLVQTLCKAWFVREDGATQTIRPPSHRDYFNAELDPNATLFIAIAQILKALEPEVDTTNAQMFSVSGSLLRRYAGFARTGSEHEAHFDDETGDEFYSLLRFFRSLHKMSAIETKQSIVKAQELRNKGNDVFKSGRFGAAIAKYTEALLLDPTNYILYSNRAAAYTYLNATDNAIEDLKKAIELKNDFETAWTRLGFSYLAKGNALESVKAYIKAIELADSNNALPQYIQKLVESLKYSEQRALSQGVSHDEISRLSNGIRPLRSRYTPRPRPQSQTTGANISGQPRQPQQAPGQPQQPGEARDPFGFTMNGNQGDPSAQTFQIFTDGNEGADVIRQAFNFMGNMIPQGGQINGQDQMNFQNLFQNAMNGQTPTPQSGNGTAAPQSAATPGAAPTQTPVNGSSERVEREASAQTFDEPVDEEMADPEVAAPEDPSSQQQPPNGQPPNTNAAPPRGFQDVFLNALPGALRHTVGPIILQSINNALSGGQEGQGATFATVRIDGDGTQTVNGTPAGNVNQQQQPQAQQQQSQQQQPQQSQQNQQPANAGPGPTNAAENVRMSVSPMDTSSGSSITPSATTDASATTSSGSSSNGGTSASHGLNDADHEIPEFDLD